MAGEMPREVNSFVVPLGGEGFVAGKDSGAGWLEGDIGTCSCFSFVFSV